MPKSKRAKSTKEGTANKAARAQRNLIRSNQLLSFMRLPKNTDEKLELLQTMDQALENAYQVVHLLPSGTPEEDECLAGIRTLEDRRFDLLSQIHGNQIEAYRWVSS